MWLSQSARSAGSALVAIVEVGNGSTPSLTTSASISPTCTAYRDGTRSMGLRLSGCKVLSVESMAKSPESDRGEDYVARLLLRGR